MRTSVKYAVAGTLAGAANGCFGGGGGMVLLPLLTRWCHVEEKKAFATSLAVILPLTAVSALVYGLRDRLCWQAALPYGLGGIAGGFLAGKWLERLPTLWLRRGFGLLLMLAGARAVLA